ncbi:MAG TPA: DUF1559 domain-containing protein, partial [Planctomicrobium sp.]|nr:DUF1559 domain-containing protein [Planctomicrobium sp.]
MIAGIVALGGIGYLLAGAIHRAREDAHKSHCNLGQFRLAFQNYVHDYGELPPAIVSDSDGKPLYSWRVLLLPYLDNEKLYKEFHLDEPWDSEHNLTLIPKMPGSYHIDWKWVVDVPPHHTVYRVFYGPGTLFEGGISLKDCPDGLDSTLLLVEAGDPIPWSMPEDFKYHPDRPIHLQGIFHKRTRGITLEGGYKYLPDDLPQSTLHALVTRNGGET